MTQSKTYKKEDSLQNYLSKTFFMIAMGVGISALVAFITSRFLPYIIYRFIRIIPAASIIIAITELGIAFYFSRNLFNMPKNRALLCYILYSVFTGLSLSMIIMIYAQATVTLAFVATTIMFVCMAVIGYTSNIDYTKIYTLFLPAVIAGLFITLLNSLIFHSSLIDMSIVYVGLILFLIITAADIQKLRSYYYSAQTDSYLSERLMILGAFQLYLDFVNLFIRILRIFGRRNKE